MDRTEGADNVDIGGGRRGFRSQNLAVGLIGTEVDGDWCNMIQEEIMSVIEDPTLVPPIVPDKNNWGQLLEAIERKIDALRVDMPIYPDVQTLDGKFTVTSPVDGTIRIGAGTEWTMRGMKSYTSAQTDLGPTAANKTYHVRFVGGAFGLYDLAALPYNPTALAETDPAFDSTYDNMLIARVTTSPTNVPTITMLANKAVLKKMSPVGLALPSALDWIALSASGVDLNWARTPDWAEPMWQGFRSFADAPTGVVHGLGAGIIRALEIRKSTVTRYAIGNLEYWYEDDQPNQGYISFNWTISAG